MNQSALLNFLFQNKTIDSTTDLDYFYLSEFVECNKLNLISLYLIFMFTLSLFLNILLLIKFFNNKHLLTNINILIITLTIFNLVGTLLEFPLIIINSIFCK